MTLLAHVDCPTCADHVERIAWLESELGWRKDKARVKLLKAAFGLTKKEVMFLEMLYGAHGLPVPRWRLETATLGPDEEEAERVFADNLVSIYVCRLRKKLGHAAIDTLRADGYALSPVGIALVDGVLGS